MSPPLDLFLAALALWRGTHLLQAEDGPWDLVARLRKALGSSVWGQLLDCFYCLSLWLAAPLAWWLGSTLTERCLLWWALSGAACLLERATAPPAPPTTSISEGASALPLFYEDPVSHDSTPDVFEPDDPQSPEDTP